ncbi:c-type cytochrome [Sphingobacterium spiritivorum]|uniref:c-type cytochrome n=1 Tax=Sphingobacterium TaxID=28453 RepID=UPI0025CF5611|nr:MULTISPECIES: c-type cytochrome [unclassified Sphingobacterium]
MKFLTILSCLAAVYLISLFNACQPNVSIQTAQYAVNGQKLYTTHCQNCHGAKGEGLGKLYPPLTDAKYFQDNRNILPCIIKNGISGPIEINGETFNEKMPGVPELTEVDIAYILTYITTTFAQETEKYSQEEVRTNLQNCK